MPSLSEFIELQEVIDARRKIRRAYLDGVWKFSLKAVPITLLVSIALVIGTFLLRQDLPPRAFIALAVMLFIGFVLAPVLLFAGYMVRQYIWYHKQLGALEKRLRRGEQVARPNTAFNTDARQETPRAG